MPLTIILAECGIELIPKEIRNRPSVKQNLEVKNYYSQLLDNALHHSAMHDLKNKDKRGRPDITHICLLNALGSQLNKSGNLKLFVHTLTDKIFEINPELRIARNYNRFKGLIANLLLYNEIVDGDNKLITSVDGTLLDLLNSYQNSEIMVLSRKGTLVQNFQKLFPEQISKNYIAIIGGFQKGNFSKEIMALSNNIVSISQYPLDAWIVVNKIITYYEIIHNIA